MEERPLAPLEELIRRIRLQVADPFDASGHGGDIVFGRESAECARRIVELLEPIADGRACKFGNGCLEWPGGGMNLDMLRALLAPAGYRIVGSETLEAKPPGARGTT